MADTCCKVGRVIAERDLALGPDGDSDEHLVARWRGDGDYPETGLRTLADWFNRQLLKDAYVAHGRSTMDTRVESEYDALAGDDDIARGEVIDDLRTDGIDGDALRADFISKSTLQRHLTDCLDAEKDTGGRSDRDWERDRIAYATRTARENVDGALRSLENRGVLPGATDAEVDVEVVLRCPECATRVRFRTALDRGYVCRDHLGAAATE